jgi:hypothetical protein
MKTCGLGLPAGQDVNPGHSEYEAVVYPFALEVQYICDTVKIRKQCASLKSFVTVELRICRVANGTFSSIEKA